MFPLDVQTTPFGWYWQTQPIHILAKTPKRTHTETILPSPILNPKGFIFTNQGLKQEYTRTLLKKNKKTCNHHPRDLPRKVIRRRGRKILKRSQRPRFSRIVDGVFCFGFLLVEGSELNAGVAPLCSVRLEQP